MQKSSSHSYFAKVMLQFDDELAGYGRARELIHIMSPVIYLYALCHGKLRLSATLT